MSQDLPETEIPIGLEDIDKYPPFSWMVRPCEHYKEEYKDCVGLRPRFNQYFHGNILDCSEWKADYNRCKAFRKTGDTALIEEIVENEKERVRRRFKGHDANDVWERRTAPPDNWDTPIPDHFVVKNKSSAILKLAQHEREENALASSSSTTCSIL